MTGKLDIFYIEHDIHGTKVMARSHLLAAASIANGEIETTIKMLKDDLDACEEEMKRVVQGRRPRFDRSSDA